MQSSPIILIGVICGFFLILGGMAAVVFISAQKSNARFARIAEALGLKPITDTDSILQKIAYVNGIEHPEMYLLKYVFHHHHAHGGDVYFYNLYRRDIKAPTISQSSKSSKIHEFPLEESALAFVSPLWKLPRFVAFPKLQGGKVADFSNALAEKAFDIKHEIIKSPHIPSFDEKYILGTLEASSQVRPTDGFLRILASTQDLTVRMGGDTLTLAYVHSSTHKPDEEQMKQLYKIGMQLARELQG